MIIKIKICDWFYDKNLQDCKEYVKKRQSQNENLQSILWHKFVSLQRTRFKKRQSKNWSQIFISQLISQPSKRWVVTKIIAKSTAKWKFVTDFTTESHKLGKNVYQREKISCKIGHKIVSKSVTESQPCDQLLGFINGWKLVANFFLVTIFFANMQ